MIIVNVQFNCDGPDCRAMKQTSGNPETITAKMNEMLESGWERRGRKCFCPNCARNQVESGNWQNQIGG